jgi:twinkle protein
MGLGVQVAEIPHDKCGGEKSLKVFRQPDGRVDGFCFRCGSPDGYVRHPFGDDGTVPDDLPVRQPKDPERVKEEMAEIETFQTLSVPKRRLKKTTLEYFGAKVSVSEQDGTTPTAIYWPITKGSMVTGYKVKLLDPPPNYTKAYNIGDVTDCDLVGWREAKTSGAYRLYVCEGPENMAAIRQIFETHGKEEFQPAVVSLPHGAACAKHYLTKFAKEITNTFREVVINFDPDPAGEKALKESIIILPQAKTVSLPFKDANQCIVEGAAKAAFKALAWSTFSPKSTSLVFAPAIHMKARTPAEWGVFTYPFPTLQDLTRGVRLGETVYIGAGVKMGKGELRDTLASHFIKEHDAKVMMASYEQGLTQSYKRIAGKMVSKIFHDPKIEFDDVAYDKAGELLANNLVMLDIYQKADVETTKADIIAAAEWGAKAIFIDPITNFTNGKPAGEANTILQGMAQDYSQLARDLDVAMFFFCHLKEPEGNLSKESRRASYSEGRYIGLGNCPHEHGGDIMSAQFAGSRGMMRSCHLMIGIEGNKDPEIEDTNTRNIRHIKLLEDREFGESGTIPVFWNKDTGRFVEM